MPGLRDAFDLGARLPAPLQLDAAGAHTADLLFEKLLFMRTDSNGDGALDFAEFTGMLRLTGRVADAAAAEENAVRFFSHHFRTNDLQQIKTKLKLSWLQ